MSKASVLNKILARVFRFPINANVEEVVRSVYGDDANESYVRGKLDEVERRGFLKWWCDLDLPNEEKVAQMMLDRYGAELSELLADTEEIARLNRKWMDYEQMMLRVVPWMAKHGREYRCAAGKDIVQVGLDFADELLAQKTGELTYSNKRPTVEGYYFKKHVEPAVPLIEEKVVYVYFRDEWRVAPERGAYGNMLSLYDPKLTFWAGPVQMPTEAK